MADETLLVVAALGASLAAAGWLAHRIRLPPAVGYLAVGLAAAPLAGRSILFGEQGLKTTSQVGVLFVLFLIGLELDLKTLRDTMRRTALTIPFDILVPGAAAFALGRLVGWTTTQAAVLGLVACLSSTLFGERLASGRGFPPEARRRTLGILLSEDVAAAALLATLAVLGGGSADWWTPLASLGQLAFLFILLTAGALLVMPPLLDAVARRHSNELVILAAGGLVVGFGAAGAWAGSAELGALLAGVAAAEAGSRFVLRNAVQSVRDLALALFFFVSGLQTDVGAAVHHLGLAAALAALFLGSKLLVHIPASLAARLDGPSSLRTALALGNLGEFNLVLLAAAQAAGLANPLLAPTVIGAMLLLLMATPLLSAVSPWIASAAKRSPERIRRPFNRLVAGVRTASPPEPADPSRRRVATLLLLANLILLLGWGLLSAWAGPRLAQRFDPGGLTGSIVAFGVGVAVATPLLLRSYRAYRDLVRMLVGLDPAAPAEGAGRVRARLVDAWVAATAVLLLVPIVLVVPSTLPVLLGGFALAVAIVALAWRQLSRFQATLEGTVTRVLGHDPKTSLLLDQVLHKYPWGMRFAAGTVAPDSPVAGMTIQESRIAELTGAMVAVVQRQGRETVNPDPGTRLAAGDTVVLVGQAEELAKAEALLVAHGEALRATVRSRLAEIVEVPVEATSTLVGQSLGSADLRGRTGALVVGLWPHGAGHPEPFRPDLVLQVEDHLILLGSPLQVERARLLAGPPNEAEPGAAPG